MKLMSLRRRLGRYRFIVRAVNWWRRQRDELSYNLRFLPARRRTLLGRYAVTVPERSLNVMIIVVDSLRNDALSCNGYFRHTTPFLDTFDCRFTAISTSPWTYPSVASILTGMYPHNHGAFLSGNVKDLRKPETYLPIRKDVLTLPELMRALGYKVYFSTAIGMVNYPGRTAAVPKLYTPPTDDSAERILGDLTRCLAGHEDSRFFAYVQLADLHPPIRLPQTYKHWFGIVKDLPEIDGWDFKTEARRKVDPSAFEEYKEQRRLLYDNAVRYVDSAIEAFCARLSSMGLADRTLLIITGDHGEQFWEHANLDAKHVQLVREVCGVSHGDSLYNETIQVPLLLRGPLETDVPKCRVSTVDIAPTVLDFLGISPAIRFDGRNLFGSRQQRLLISEACARGYDKKVLVMGNYKLNYSRDEGIEWLFDLDKDPAEQNPITDRAVTSLFTQKLLAILELDEKRMALETIRKTCKKQREPANATGRD